jgi:Mn-dependent DtxR family transcriptional regulator
MQESGENYLETILLLKERNGSVRSIDIAHELGYAKPASAGRSAYSKKPASYW